MAKKNKRQLRRSADKIRITHDLTVQQREEHDLIKEAKNKEECDQSERFLSTEFVVHHRDGICKKLVKFSEERKA